MEPLVQGAAGMITHPTGLLRKIRDLCDHYEVLLIWMKLQRDLAVPANCLLANMNR